MTEVNVSNPSSLPTTEMVWERVADFARDRLQEHEPIYTVKRGVRNFITDVKDNSIGRRSDEGTSNVSRVTRAMVGHLWSERTGNGQTGSYLYFTKALVLGALPDVVEYMDGDLVIRNDPAVVEEKARRRKLAQSDSRGRGGGEGELHKKIKEFVHQDPDRALSNLNGGPFQSVAIEYVFPTGDRIDVVLIDGSGKILLVEVKPFLAPGDLAPFAQAAKYRLLWHIFEERPTEEIRCVVVAPDIAKSPWKRMLDAHAVESLAVRLDENA